MKNLSRSLCVTDKPTIRGPRPGGYTWTVQIMPADGWQAVYYHSGEVDGPYAEELVGWAIEERLIEGEDLKYLDESDREKWIVERRVVGLINAPEKEIHTADDEALTCFSNYAQFLGYVHEFFPEEWQDEADRARARYKEQFAALGNH